uniref:C2H2-type domain-containing protein n=1 Tax=Esox lucius TaxID=8010 RepID=A0AAY5KTQ7_ESOLU
MMPCQFPFVLMSLSLLPLRYFLHISLSHHILFPTCRERQIRCPKCDKHFSRTNHLKKHLNSHEGRRDYICEKCEKAFLTKYHLTRHVKICKGPKTDRGAQQEEEGEEEEDEEEDDEEVERLIDPDRREDFHTHLTSSLPWEIRISPSGPPIPPPGVFHPGRNPASRSVSSGKHCVMVLAV